MAESKDRLRIKTSDGKYEVVQPHEGGAYANRYDNERWRDLTGDNLILALAYDLEEAREEIAKMKKEAAEGVWEKDILND